MLNVKLIFLFRILDLLNIYSKKIIKRNFIGY